MAETHVTICVPVKDRRERMLRCLDSLLGLDHPSYDVLVLDNGSTDGTPEACAARAAGAAVPVRVETVDGRVGLVRNVGLRLARGEIVAFTDSDCVVDAGWLRAGTAPFADPQVGLVTGTTRPELEGPLGRWAATIEVTGQTWRFESCNLLVRRDACLAAGGFDERLGHFGEDTPAGWAMLHEGWRAAFAPGAVVRHDVTYPGLRWHLRRAHKYGKVAATTRRFPAARRHLLWGRFFLTPHTAKAAAAAAGLALAPASRGWLALAAPYAWTRYAARPTPWMLRHMAQMTVFDLAVLTGMVRGSARWRSLVL